MRVALISDIHGNRWALEAVLDHLVSQRVDAIWNLGDILSGPLAPAETADLLIPLNLITIRGNHERQLLACETRSQPNPYASDQYAHDHTTAHHRDWLRALPAAATPRADIALCHGSPRSDLEPLLETVEGDGQRPATLDEIAPRTDAVTAQLIACGHTHVARVVRTADGRWIVNPGSVGLPAYDADHPTTPHALYYVDTGTPHAAYAIVEDVDGAWEVGFHRVRYDWEAAAVTAERNHRPEWAHALRTGFALRA